jgi:DNA-binding transcriptional ArsR family regulator
MVAALHGKRRFKNEVYGQLARIGKALASPKRLELLDLICQAERSVEELASETAMSVANTSQHLRALHEVHLVEAERKDVSSSTDWRTLWSLTFIDRSGCWQKTDLPKSSASDNGFSLQGQS